MGNGSEGDHNGRKMPLGMRMGKGEWPRSIGRRFSWAGTNAALLLRQNWVLCHPVLGALSGERKNNRDSREAQATSSASWTPATFSDPT